MPVLPPVQINRSMKTRHYRLLPPLLTLALLFSACDMRQPRQMGFGGLVFGTYYQVTYFDPRGINHQEAIDSLFAAFNSSLSYYDPQSLISRINRGETQEADELFQRVFERAWEISAETGGAFDATVGPLVNAWGFGFAEKAQMTDHKVDSLLAFTGHQKAWMENHKVYKADPRLQFDFNAIAKGYAADLAGRYLEGQGIGSYLVEIGGDLVARGLKPDGTPWRIGLETPAPDAAAEQQWDYLIEVSNVGVATSGSYRRYHESDGMRYSHTIDPFTGHPVSHHLLSATVIASDAMSADAYATAFMVMGLEKARAFAEDRGDLEAWFVFAAQEGGYGMAATSGLRLISRQP